MSGLFSSFTETTALLTLWGNISIQRQLDSATRNRLIFQRLQQDLAALGFITTWQQCRVKIKNLTATYRKLRDSNRRSGRGRADFPYYSIIDGVLGTRPATQLVNLLSSTSSNFAPGLDRPGVSADDSEEATTDDEEDDELKDRKMEVGVGVPRVAVGVAVTQEVEGVGAPHVMVPQVALGVAVAQVMALG